MRRQIVSGALAEHSALPSERAIAEQHDVSRMTARRALAALEAEGLAYSEDRRGRYVSPQRLKYDISRTVSLTAEAQASGAALEIDVIESGETQADAVLALQLDVPVGEALFEYTRLFLVDEHAIFIETEHVIARRCPNLLDHDLSQSTTRLLEEHFGVFAEVGDIVIRMRGMREDEATLLGLAGGHAGIELEQVIRDKSGAPFCAGRQIWRGELAEFSARAMVNPTDR